MSNCRFSALNLKFDFISDGGCTREKQIQKALGSLPPCGNRCRFSESAICSSRVPPSSEIKSNFKFKTLRWRPLRWRLTLSESCLCRNLFRTVPRRCFNGQRKRKRTNRENPRTNRENPGKIGKVPKSQSPPKGARKLAPHEKGRKTF